jgi:hypothetical protein
VTNPSYPIVHVAVKKSIFGNLFCETTETPRAISTREIRRSRKLPVHRFLDAKRMLGKNLTARNFRKHIRGG